MTVTEDVPKTCGSRAPGWDCLGEALGGARCLGVAVASGSRKTTLAIGVKKIRLKDQAQSSGSKVRAGQSSVPRKPEGGDYDWLEHQRRNPPN